MSASHHVAPTIAEKVNSDISLSNAPQKHVNRWPRKRMPSDTKSDVGIPPATTRGCSNHKGIMDDIVAGVEAFMLNATQGGTNTRPPLGEDEIVTIVDWSITPNGWFLYKSAVDTVISVQLPYTSGTIRTCDIQSTRVDRYACNLLGQIILSIVLKSGIVVKLRCNGTVDANAIQAALCL